jgi:uncharacterized membrane protein YebE (DUF533 family)
MIDVNKLLTAVMTGNAPAAGGSVPQVGSRGGLPQALGGRSGGIGEFLSNNAGALGTGVLTGGLVGTVLSSKHTRKLAGTALQVGAAAVLGGLAYKAYQNYRNGQPVVPQSVTDMLGGMIPQQQSGAAQDAAPQNSYAGFLTRQTPPLAEGMLLLRAMIAAAMADGRIDDKEREQLIGRVEASGISAEEKSYLEALIAKPETPAQLAAMVNHPEVGAQVYLAAYVAIDADTPEERRWLDDLAANLGMEPQLRQNVEAAARAPVNS